MNHPQSEQGGGGQPRLAASSSPPESVYEGIIAEGEGQSLISRVSDLVAGKPAKELLRARKRTLTDQFEESVFKRPRHERNIAKGWGRRKALAKQDAAKTALESVISEPSDSNIGSMCDTVPKLDAERVEKLCKMEFLKQAKKCGPEGIKMAESLSGKGTVISGILMVRC